MEDLSISPVDLEILWSHLVAIMDETDRVLVRSAFSPIVVEGRDFACILLDRNGESLAQSVLSTTGFTATLPPTVKAFLRRFPTESLSPGDVLITNDPWLGTGHLPDVSIVLPIHSKSRELVGFIGTAAHMADIGGNYSYFDNRDVFEEGFYIPPIKLYSEGRPNDDLFSLLRANVRLPNAVIGDIRAIVGAARIGAKRLLEFLEDYDLPNLEALAKSIAQKSEQRMREAIRHIPDGLYSGQTVVDGQGIPIELCVEVSVTGEELRLDFTGSSQQVTHAAINCPLGASRGAILTTLKCMLVPDLPNNTALFKPVNIVIPEGCILNATHPAPVKGRSTVGAHTHEAIYAALAGVVPNHVQAHCGSFWGVSFTSQGVEDQRQASHMLVQGGKGAVAGLDGLSTTNYPGNGGLTPTEVFENQIPILITSRSFWVDSAGSGEFRGGLGQVLAFESRAQDPVVVVVRPVNTEYPPAGLVGGQPASLGEIILNGKAANSKTITLQMDDRLELRISGGGGFGQPTNRSWAAIQQDLRTGILSDERAAQDYQYEPVQNQPERKDSIQSLAIRHRDAT